MVTTMLSTKRFIDSCLFYFNLSGLNPQKQTVFTKLCYLFYLVTDFLIIVFLLLEVIVNWSGIASLLDGANSLVGYLQNFFKILLFMILNKLLFEILEDLKQFWPVEEIEDDALKADIKTIYGYLRKIQIFIQSWLSLTVFSYFGDLVLTKTRSYPFALYQPIDLFASPTYEITYFLLFVNTFFLISFSIGFDMLFIILATQAFCELKMLKYRFANLKISPNPGDEDACLREIGRLVDHHNFVLRFIKKFNAFFSLSMLSIFLSSMFCICLGLFTISAEGFPPRPKILAKCITFLVCYSGELFLFCFGGHIVTTESVTVSDAIYESDWWVKTQPKVRKAVVLVLMRSQRAETITAAGIFTLNLESFTDVMKTGMSFYTLMNAVYEEGAESAIENI